ncbi:MAG TPA: hypothetical protein DCS13_00250 [Candidatus Margulisbacteria bacterium]|nr:MAG: hypothetical protein A2X43_04770 [Candidatus Margulisbacteria bacterium GWD2_39_127]HAR61874.1 hypothetical protein [Candidatus Margulisiibacteriota bacterium]
MKNRLLDYFKKYKHIASLIVGIGIMLIPICVFADEIDPGIPFYYNPSNRYFGLDNPYPQYNFDVSGNIKARSTLVGGSTLLTLEDTNTDAQCTNTLFFRHYADRGLKINSIGEPGSFDNSWMNIQVHNGTSFQTILQTKVNDRSITIPNGLNVGNASGAGVGQIRISDSIYVESTKGIFANSSDGSDSKAVIINGGGGEAEFRGGQIAVCGNEFFGASGNVFIDTGRVDNSSIKLRASNGAAQLDTAIFNKLGLSLTGGLNVGNASGADIGNIYAQGLDPIIRQVVVGGTADKKTYEIRSIGASGYEGLQIRKVNDARTVWNTLLIATAGGNVGIGGINCPQYTLTVSGNVAARNFITSQAVWYDKVFSPTYNLMPLSKLESYVQEHKHLPDVPEEKEVLKNGVNMSEFQGKLLQKVEELTLYVIEQDKKNAKLVSIVEDLKKENVELKTTTQELKQENKEIKNALNELKKK